MKPSKSKQLKKTPARSRSGSLNQDPVEVYCRIKPISNNFSISCIQVISKSTVQLSAPAEYKNNNGNGKEVQYGFRQVFDENVSQKEVFDTVALPLVSQLVCGKNGLLFTYGVTGSGKTYTMNGLSNDGGIMLRCLDVIFNSISSNQAKKYIFKPDRMNNFDIQDEADAMLAYQNELMYFNQAAKSKRKRDVLADGDAGFQRIQDSTTVSCVDEDNLYAVFVTYIEIYNNSVYDLLDDSFEDCITKKLQNKVIREDGSHNMYVHGVTEIEVKSTEEAFDVFYKGQRRKRVANTLLNDASSRSHVVFTIKLVQAPLDSDGETIVQDKKLVCISQLSLVDLAGSERTTRTQNTGLRLREAGNINNSLLTLRTCLETLRDNQQNGTNRMVPYRDSKLTHLFKNYFDGEGQVRVVVCVNPSAEDYDETVQVMKFAEMTQEVQVVRPTPMKVDTGLTPGRRRANLFAKKIQLEVNEEVAAQAKISDTEVNQVRDTGLIFPTLLINDPFDEEFVKLLSTHLEDRIKCKSRCWEEALAVEDTFRQGLVKLEIENAVNSIEVKEMRTALDFEKKKVLNLYNEMGSSNQNADTLRRQLEDKENKIVALQQKLKEKEMIINQQTFEKEKVREKYVNKIAVTKEKIKKEMNAKINEKYDQINSEMKNDKEKLKLLREVLDEGAVQSRVTPRSTARSRAAVERVTPLSVNTHGTFYMPPQVASESRRGPAVCNLRHRRSISAGGASDVWLDHRPLAPVQLNTVLQPIMKKRKSVSKLTDVKDVVNSKTSKYCLTTQEQDTDGELETRLYKGDVIPTTGGGAQVVLHDVELLKQKSPTAGSCSARKRSLPDSSATADKCSVSIEGHGKRIRP